MRVMEERYKLHLGDCLEVLKTLPDASVDAVVTDPPYGLAFMGKAWDHSVPSIEVWQECLRVAKPGAHLLSFAGTRTQHRMACAIEDAGFEIRDMIAWVYGSGFPKSLDVSKAIDKAAGAERDVIKHHVQSATRPNEHAGASAHITMPNSWDITAPATPEAQQWQGWGTALKPSLEPITLARKPLDGTVAANVLEHGTGGLNIDGCRVGTDERLQGSTVRNDIRGGAFATGHKPNPGDIPTYQQNSLGRWPANLIHDGSDEVLEGMPHGASGGAKHIRNGSNGYGGGWGVTEARGYAADREGSVARFFYCAKASKQDRDEGCETLDARTAGCMNMRNDAHAHRTGNTFSPKRNTHPTVKPTDLMRYLCRLVTPPNGIVLDPFMGSGSTGKAAMLEGFDFIGIELEPEYMEIAKRRIQAEAAQRRMF